MQVRSKSRELSSARGGSRTRAFTLIELLIVIAIMALLSAIVLGTITRMGASNRRLSCQSNLAQIYQSCRLYQQDEGGFPFYDSPSDSPDAAAGLDLENNIGLWALYAFPKESSAPGVNNANPQGPVGRYLRSSRVLHCPQDTDPANQSLLLSPTTFNNGYLSYQSNLPVNYPDTPSQMPLVPSYQSIRTTNKSNANWKRQLVSFNGAAIVDRAPADSTIVTWCPFHRKAVGGRDFDNVLFYDGSVQLVPRQQDTGDVGWQRLPKAPS